MWNEMLETILLFKNFILTAVPVVAILMLTAYVCTRRFSWTGGRRLVYGWFFGRTDREFLWAGASLMQFLFVLSSVLTGTEMEPAHLLFLVLLSAVKAAAGKTPAIFGRDTLNSILLFAALMVGNILQGYLRETRFNMAVAVVLVLLGVFLILYTGYFFLKDIGGVEKNGEKTKERGRGRKE